MYKKKRVKIKNKNEEDIYKHKFNEHSKRAVKFNSAKSLINHVFFPVFVLFYF